MLGQAVAPYEYFNPMRPHPTVERWRSRSTFVLALAIAAAGLGNVWRFAYLMGENGGAPFLFSYVFCLLVVGAPLLIAEVVLGSHGRGSPLLTLDWATEVSGRSRLWLVVALLSCSAGFLLLACYLVIAGWSLDYAYQLQLSAFAALGLEDTGAVFAQRLDEPAAFLRWQLLAAALLAVICAAGVRRGIGLMAWISVPLLMVLLGVLCRYAIDFGNLEAAGEYLFRWQSIDFHGASFMAAMVHAVYTLCVGVAFGMTYGAYTPDKLPIVRSVLAVAFFDVVVAVAIGVAVFPLVFASNLLPSDGFGLLFISLPYAYGNLPFGDVYGALFFIAIFVIAMGTAVALMEPAVAILEQQFNIRRVHAAAALAALAWALSALATTDLSADGFFQWLDSTTADVLIPLGGLLLAVFVGWRMPRAVLRKELIREPDILFTVWYFLIRFVAGPVIIIAWLWLYLVP
ncbi:MAG: sodium-dependent transporter [Congregibacter sp.]